MTNSDLKFKCFVEGEPLKTAKTFDMNDVNLCPPNIPHFDLALPFVHMHDADKTDVYAGDVLCLTITDELMNTTFSNSNLGKYIKDHPDITEVYLAINQPREGIPAVPFNYRLYFTHNHKIERWNDDDPDSDDNSIMHHCCGEDTLFPKYVSVKGAKIVANLYETPDFLNNL